MNTIMAIDLGKFKSVICFYNISTAKDTYTTFNTGPQELHDLVVAHPVDLIVFEACDIIGWVSDLLDDLEVKYIIANTNSDLFSGKHLKRKTDKKDALRLARLAVLGELSTVYVPKKEVRQKRALINYRQNLTERITQVKNTIRSLLNCHAYKLPHGKSGWSQKSIAYLRSLARPLAEVDFEQLWRGSLWTELNQLESLTDALLIVQDKLEELNAADKNVQLLKTVPGVGDRLAEAVVAYIDDPHRFSNCKQVGCYVGMTPRQYQSGTTDRHGRISKDGNRLLRSLLVEVCWLGLRHNPWIRETYDRIKRDSKTRSKVAIVATARRLFVRLWAMMRDGTPWQMPELQTQII
ncbi:MAG: IS110 family transposase [Sedimentisphaerales bacterium]|nr:IS110 family transposase [Sedimentisphaerales bacterium]